MSRMRSVSAPFSISSIRAILSSVIVVSGVRVRCRYPHSNRRLAMTTSSVACSYTTPWGTTLGLVLHIPDPEILVVKLDGRIPIHQIVRRGERLGLGEKLDVHRITSGRPL